MCIRREITACMWHIYGYLNFSKMEMHTTMMLIEYSTSIYRKQTHTDQYLPYQSYHHPRVKSGIINCLRARAENVCRGSDITREKEHLLDVFVANGYPEEITRKALVSKERKKGGQTKENERMDKLCIPYINGLSENVEKALKDLEVRTVFKTNLTLRDHLTKVRTPSDPVTTKGVVYRIPCECGRVYVGETGENTKAKNNETQMSCQECRQQ